MHINYDSLHTQDQVLDLFLETARASLVRQGTFLPVCVFLKGDTYTVRGMADYPGYEPEVKEALIDCLGTIAAADDIEAMLLVSELWFYNEDTAKEERSLGLIYHTKKSRRVLLFRVEESSFSLTPHRSVASDQVGGALAQIIGLYEKPSPVSKDIESELAHVRNYLDAHLPIVESEQIEIYGEQLAKV